jgi:hypothetical protein
MEESRDFALALVEDALSDPRSVTRRHLLGSALANLMRKDRATAVSYVDRLRAAGSAELLAQLADAYGWFDDDFQAKDLTILRRRRRHSTVGATPVEVWSAKRGHAPEIQGVAGVRHDPDHGFNWMKSRPDDAMFTRQLQQRLAGYSRA